MAGFNMGLPGNPAADHIASRGTLPVEEAQYLALMAVAFEQRTANLIAYAVQDSTALAEGVDVEIRERLGMPPAP